MKPAQNMIFGARAVLEAVSSGKDLEKVLIKRGPGSTLLRELYEQLRKKEVPLQRVPVEKLNAITGKNHQGVIAYLSEIIYTDITTLLPTIYEKGEVPLLLVLDRVTDVRNFGAIARTAECAGVHAVLIPAGGSARINADAVKTSAGALHRIPVSRYADQGTMIRFLKDSGLKLVAATEKAEHTMYKEDFTLPVALILGSEENGISGSLRKSADAEISIPMKGTIASLNVSVAAGILLFEILRQRKE